MSNPTITLTRFDRQFRTNHFHDDYHQRVGGEACIGDYMLDCIKRHSDEAQPRYWSFARYKSKKHSKEAIRYNTAITLEFPLSARAELEMELAELGFAHYLIPTDDTQTNHIAVVFPLEEPILMDPKSNRYARIASVLMEQIGVMGATEGCIAPTFLIRPITNARAESFLLNGFLNADTFIRETAEMKAKASKFVGDGEEAVAAPGDDLFDWGSAA